jgi:hypothetical protein
MNKYDYGVVEPKFEICPAVANPKSCKFFGVTLSPTLAESASSSAKHVLVAFVTSAPEMRGGLLFPPASSRFPRSGIQYR